MLKRLAQLAFALLTVAAMGTLAAQQVSVRPAAAVSMPAPVDSNSPAFWRDGRLYWFGSHGGAWLNEGPDQFGPWQSRELSVDLRNPWPTWLESVWPEDNDVLWGWYHTEPTDLIADSSLTAPKIGAVVSLDGGRSLRDLGIVLESGDPLNPSSQNGYFAGGHGDFTVILDRERTYFYFLFDNYGGADATQGVCIARMAFADRNNPEGKVWKYYNGSWQEAGLGGRVTPIFPVKKPWQTAEPDALWGPSVHWNTYLNCYVMLLNHAAGGDPGWRQEGIYVSFCSDLSRPDLWTQPRKILGAAEFPGWYFFYPQVMGLEPGGTDRRAGKIARLYVNGISKWEIEFGAAEAAPSFVEISSSTGSGVVPAGREIVLSANVTASGPFTYQWNKDGVPIPQATSASFTIGSMTANDSGVYTVTITNAYGVRTSAAFPVSVAVPEIVAPRVPPPAPPAPVAFLSNLSVRTALSATAAELTVGFVVQSTAPKPLILRAVGPSLALYGVPDYERDPRLRVFDAQSSLIAENDDWTFGDADAFTAVGAFPLVPGSADSGSVVNVPAGSATTVISGRTGGSTLVEIYDPAPSTEAKIVNLSARVLVGAADDVLIGGFAVAGSGTKRLLIRAMGPQLAAFGVANPLSDPVLAVYNAGAEPIAENDDWNPGTETAFVEAGASLLPAGSRDAALVLTVVAGNSYTVIVRSGSGTVGEALLEIFELP